MRQAGAEIEIEDAYSFCLLHSMIQSGQVCVAIIDISTCPMWDAKVTENNGVLSASLSERSTPQCKWESQFWGGKDSSDGAIKWTGIADFFVIKSGKIADTVSLYSGSLPLEVGTISAAKTLTQILHGGVARWPYRQNKLTIFKLMDCVKVTSISLEYK